jgi:hypothetical protein
MTTHTTARHSPSYEKQLLFSLVVASGCIGDNIFFTFLIKLAKNSTNTKNTLVNM